MPHRHGFDKGENFDEQKINNISTKIQKNGMVRFFII